MTFSEIAKSLGVETYPEMLESIYEEVKLGAKAPFDRELIDRHQRERNLCGDHYEDVIKGLEDLQAKPAAMAYATVGALYLQRVGQKEATKFILPKPDGSPALDMLGVLVAMSMVDHGIAEYVRRGTPREDAEKFMKNLTSNIHSNIRRHGRPGLDQTYFNWFTLMIYALLFPCGGFKFNVSTVGKFFYVLRNKHTGETVVMLDGREIHRDGGILEAAGLSDDPEGAFYVEVKETPTEWTGHPANEKGLISRQLHHYPKTDWEMAVRPGDCVLSIHLPAGMRLEKELTRNAIRDAFAHAKKYYPDYSPKALKCSSWLLNPELKDILGEDSNIVAFASMFHLYPIGCKGQAVFNFVFKTSVNPDLATLPEDTRLQRALKAKYLAGGYHHNYGGFILPEDIL